MQSCFGPVSGTFLRTFGLKKGKHRSFKKPPFAMATMNFHAELLNGRRIAISIPLDMTIRELKEELKVWRAVAVFGFVCFLGGKKRLKKWFQKGFDNCYLYWIYLRFGNRARTWAPHNFLQFFEGPSWPPTQDSQGTADEHIRKFCAVENWLYF